MNLFDLIELAELPALSKRIKEGTNAGKSYDWKMEVEDFLEYVRNNEEQVKIISEKFNQLENQHQFFDKLTELMVASKFLSKNPELCHEQGHGPDIFLNQSGEDIEVKRLNKSNYEKCLLSKIDPNSERYDEDLVKKEDFNDGIDRSALFDQIEVKISQALRQLGDSGKVILVYSLDTLNAIESGKYIKSCDVELAASFYFESKSKGQHSLMIVHENQLFLNTS